METDESLLNAMLMCGKTKQKDVMPMGAIDEAKNEDSTRNTSLTQEEYLSGFRKEDRLTPVITLTLCLSAEPWDAPTSLHEMLDVEDKRLLRFVPDYKLNLLTPAQITDEEFAKFRTGLGAVMQFAKHRNDKDVSWMEGNKRFEQMDWDTASLIKTVTGANIQIEKGESINMWAAWENGINQARNDGREAGRNEGESNMMTAIRMIREDKPIDAIRKETGISDQRLTELRSML